MATAPQNTAASAVSESASKQIPILEDDGGLPLDDALGNRGQSVAQSGSFNDLDAEHYLG